MQRRPAPRGRPHARARSPPPRARAACPSAIARRSTGRARASSMNGRCSSAARRTASSSSAHRSNTRVGAARVAEVPGDADGRLARARIRVRQEARHAVRPCPGGRASSARRWPPAGRSRRRGRGARAAARTRAGRRSGPARRRPRSQPSRSPSSSARERLGRARIAETPERTSPPPRDLLIVGLQLVDEQIPTTPAPRRTSASRTSARRSRVGEQARQGALDGGSLHPAEEQRRARAARLSARAPTASRIRCAAGGRQRGLELRDDVGAAAVLAPRTRRGGGRSRPRSAPTGARGRSRSVDERPHDVPAAELAERLDHRRASTSSSSSGTRRGATRGSSIRASASIAGKARKKSRGLGDARQRIDGLGGAQTPERLDRVEPDVRVGILERRDERGDRGRMALLAEGQRRLHAQIGIGVAQQLGERRR